MTKSSKSYAMLCKKKRSKLPVEPEYYVSLKDKKKNDPETQLLKEEIAEMENLFQKQRYGLSTI